MIELVDEMIRLIEDIADAIRPYSDDVALAMVATILVIFGDHINSAVRTLVKKQPFWLRLLAFIALCSIGYGALSVWLTPLLENLLRNLPGWQLLTVIVGSFLMVAVVAQKQRKI